MGRQRTSINEMLTTGHFMYLRKIAGIFSLRNTVSHFEISFFALSNVIIARPNRKMNLRKVMRFVAFVAYRMAVR